MSHGVELIQAKEKDMPLIAELAGSIWHEHYTDIIGKEQVDYMLKMMYDYDHLVKQLTVDHHLFYLIRYNMEVTGFIAVSNAGGNTYYLHKFYLAQNLSGKGHGSEAFQTLLKLLQPEELKLTVNRMNYKSVNFYFKNGFKIEKPVMIDIGNGYVMDDFLMIWKRESR